MLRIALVDDERIVLKGMSHLLKRYYPKHEIVGMFQNGYDAIKLAESTENIDVVIADIKMPQISGVDLIERIKEINSKIFIIALSSYSDYSYVRQSMLNGAYDYLLKPCKPKDVCHLLSKIQRIKDNENILEQKRYYRKQISSLLTYANENITIFEEGDEIQMFLISPRNSFDEYIYDIIEKNLASYYSGKYDFVRHKNHILILFTNCKDKLENRRRMQNFVKNLSTKKIDLSCSEYSFRYSRSAFIEAYNILKSMINFAEFNQYHSMLTYDIYNKFLEQQKSYSFSHYFDKQKVIKFIMESKLKKLRDYIDGAVNELYHLSVYFDPNKLKKDIMHELLSIESYLSSYGIYMIKDKEENYDIIQRINDSGTLYVLLTNFKRILISAYSSYARMKETPKYIADAISYMESNYMHDISLNDVAEHVYLNPWYFSAQFKKHMGTPMSEYLNMVRVKAAKELLKQKDLMIYQVAEMVGFNDPTYFSTVFKRIEKMSPKQYRNIS